MRVIAEDRQKVEILYDRYGDKLYRIAYSVMQNQADAEDALQEVFTGMMAKMPQFESEEHEENWLVRVTVNKCKDILRRNKIRVYTPIEEVLHIGEDAKFEKSPVLESVMSLPEKYREVIILYYFEEYSVQRIGEMLGLGNSAVKMRLARGREILKTNMGREDAL